MKIPNKYVRYTYLKKCLQRTEQSCACFRVTGTHRAAGKSLRPSGRGYVTDGT
jgi:hypothetical protein